MNERGTILITGASGGIGRVLSEEMLKEGYTVMMQYHTHKLPLDALTKAYPGRAYVVKADLSSPDEIARMAEEVSLMVGDVDILVNNAGVPSAGISWKVPLDEWNRVMTLNLTAPFLVSQHVIPAMRRNMWGRIIFFSSIVAQKGITGTSCYAASKSGLFGLTKAMAKDVAQFGITVNCIAPGYMDAGMIREIPDEMQKQLIAETPAGSLGDPLSLAETVLYLANKRSGFITGQTIPVNGGLYM